MKVSVDRIIAELAALQHGVVSRRQLLAGGVPGCAVDRRVRDGRLFRLGRGVYRVGPLLGPLAAEWTSVLTAADGAALAEWSAASLWRLATSALPVSPVTLWVPGTASGRNPMPGVSRCRDLLPDEITRRDGLPLTTVARTLLDLARTDRHADFEDAVASALRKRLVTRAELREMASRHSRHRGSKALAALVEDDAATASRSEAERRIRRLCASGGLPTPEVNVKVHGFEVDLYFRKQRVALEMDGFAYHASRAAFDSDRHRDGILAAAGIQVIRITWSHLTRQRDATLVRIAQALVLRDPGVRLCSCGGQD